MDNLYLLTHVLHPREVEGQNIKTSKKCGTEEYQSLKSNVELDYSKEAHAWEWRGNVCLLCRVGEMKDI